jgi:DeoR/GlpR family transcriptional regulator of sugar metabolism
LYRACDPVDAAAPDDSTLNERQRAALGHVREHGSFTFHEFRALCPAVQPSVLQRDLREMVTAGLLRKVGARRGVYYIVP